LIVVSGLLRKSASVSRRRFGLSALSLAAAALLAGCAGTGPGLSPGTPLGQGPEGALAGEPPAVPPPAVGEPGPGAVKVALILPLSASGNAGLAAQSMRNAAELALAEFTNPNIQLLIKDDAGNPTAARQAATQAIDEGAEIIIGSLFAHTVQAVGSVARPRGIPVIAFSTDASVAARGVYLLSFLPESDVVRVLNYAFSTGKRSFAGLIPDNAYGSVVEAAFREDVARRGGRVVALERYASEKGKQADAARVIAQAARSADAIFIPDGPDTAPNAVLALTNAGVTKRTQLLGTGLWEDQRVFQDAGMQGAWYAAPDPAGFANFAQRYRAKYGQDPVRTATLSYDATALIAALVRTQGLQRFSEEVLTNPSGFAGIDGIFRFKPDGTNERGLAVMRVSPGGAQIVSPSPRSFTGASGI
jgi:ABC-type branched-subunit amino acid transport system substrate-binding protein